MNIKNNKNNNPIPKIIKNIRFELNLTQVELANKIGLSPGSIHKYENNEMDPTYRSIRKIKEFCERSGINWDDLKNIKNQISNYGKEDNYAFEIQRKYINKLEDEIRSLKSLIVEKNNKLDEADQILKNEVKNHLLPNFVEDVVEIKKLREDENVSKLAFSLFRTTFYHNFDKKDISDVKIDELFAATCVAASRKFPNEQIGPLFYQVAHHILTNTSIEDQGGI
jgi:putative transcriptional regulator